MIVSFHVVEYRTPVVAPPKGLVGDTPGLRFWRPFNVGGDFAWFRQHPTRRALYPRLRPNFHRWAFYGVWEDDDALEAFLTGSSVATSWRDRCAEAWHVRLQPVRATGPWKGIRLLSGALQEPEDARPVAHLVRLDLTVRGTLAMWGSAAPKVLGYLPDNDEMLAGIPLVDRPYSQPMSFSVWRSEESARAFAHHRTGHPEAVARVRRAQANLMERYSSATFFPYRYDGTWMGREPLGGSVGLP